MCLIVTKNEHNLFNSTYPQYSIRYCTIENMNVTIGSKRYKIAI